MQGWQPDKFYPDFIAVTNKNSILALEWKGEHLLGNEDTTYKVELAKEWERLGSGKLHFFLFSNDNVDEVLNPYASDVEMFKIEPNEDDKLMDNVWFYGTSAKCYCLYQITDNKIEILKHTSHGLGGLIGLNEDDIKRIWSDFLSYHYSILSKEAIESKYSSKFVMGKLAMTSPFVLQRFKRINKDKQIRPSNFVIVGVGHRIDNATKEPIIPMISYTKNYDLVPYTSFIDYKTGKEYTDNTKFYWKPLPEFLFAYVDHNDGKYDGEIGELRRKQIVISDIEHIGKESNNLEESEVIGVSDNDYVVYDNKTEQKIADVIKDMTTKDARRIGLSKRHLFRLEKRIKHNQSIQRLHA